MVTTKRNPRDHNFIYGLNERIHQYGSGCFNWPVLRAAGPKIINPSKENDNKLHMI